MQNIFPMKITFDVKKNNMLSFRKAFLILILGLLFIAGANVAQATPTTLNAGHFSVTYDDIQAGLYKQGALSRSLDTVYFQPNTLTALSGGRQVSTQTSFHLTLTIDPGFTFAGLSRTERGDYFRLDGRAINAVASVHPVNPATLDAAVLNLAPGSPLVQTMGSTPWELTGGFARLGLGAPQTLLVTLDNALFSAPLSSLQ